MVFLVPSPHLTPTTPTPDLTAAKLLPELEKLFNLGQKTSEESSSSSTHGMSAWHGGLGFVFFITEPGCSLKHTHDEAKEHTKEQRNISCQWAVTPWGFHHLCHISWGSFRPSRSTHELCQHFIPRERINDVSGAGRSTVG